MSAMQRMKMSRQGRSQNTARCHGRRSSARTWMSRCAALLIGVVGPFAAARGEPIVVEFDGTVSSKYNQAWQPAIQIGSSFSGSLTIDPAAAQPPQKLSGQTNAYFYDLVPDASLTVTIEGVTFTEQIAAIAIENDSTFASNPGPLADRWATAASNSDGLFINLTFTDANAARLANTNFFVNQDLAGWTSATLGISGSSAPYLTGTLSGLTQPVQLFAPGVVYEAGPYIGTHAPLHQLDAGDLDRDGRLDLIFANVAGVLVLHGNGDGAFAEPVAIPEPSATFQAFNALAKDFDRDGWLDLAISSFTSDRPGYVAFGRDEATFTPGSGIPYGHDLDCADLNGDGAPDVVTDGWPYFGLLFGVNDGSGGFAAVHETEWHSHTFAVADYDRDGFDDVLSLWMFPESGVLLLSDGGGGVRDERAIVIDDASWDVVAGDFDEDGSPDFLVQRNGTISVYRGRGDGTFEAPLVAVTTTSDASHFSAGDMNGDGHLDVVVSHPAIGRIEVFLGTGTGDFSEPPISMDAEVPQASLIADFDGDCRNDLVVAQRSDPSTVLVFMNTAGAARCATRLRTTPCPEPGMLLQLAAAVGAVVICKRPARGRVRQLRV